MKRHWELDELIENFTFTPNELDQIVSKSGISRLGFAVLFKFFQYEARFPNHKNEIPKEVILYISKQLYCESYSFEDYDFSNRNIKYHRAQIRQYFGFRESTIEDMNIITEWLSKNAFYHGADVEELKEVAYNKFKELHIEPPTPDRIERIIKSAIFTCESQFFQETYDKLSEVIMYKMDNLIKCLESYEKSDFDYNAEAESITFSELRSDPGRIGLESVFREINKLRTIKQLEIPNTLFNNIPKKILKRYKDRVISEDLREIKRHPDGVKYTLLASFFWLRGREITDNLIELLIQIIHRINVKAERKIDKEFINDFKRVNGKTGILFQMANIALNNPDGIIKEVLFPVVSENTLSNLVKEFKNTGTVYRERVYTVMRASYSHHYRRMVPEILNTIEFKSNNESYQPIIKALEIVKKYYHSVIRYFLNMNEIPIDGVIKSSLRDAIIEKDENGKERINRINYEIITLQSLRDKLRCKEIWVLGADRYRNPDEDLPMDFEEKREENYNALNKPLNPEKFINNIKKVMYDSLTKLDNDMPKNPKVKITNKNNKPWIILSPSEAQEEPINLSKLKSKITQQ